MASLDRADPFILGHILQEHRELHALLRSAREALQPPPKPATAATKPVASPSHHGCKRIATALKSLRDHLAVHFAQEEEGGFVEECLARLPRLATEAKQVLAEHPSLLSEADRLIKQTDQGDIPAARWTSLCDDVDRFTTRLLDHERRENNVVQQGYNEDLGLCDD